VTPESERTGWLGGLDERHKKHSMEKYSGSRRPSVDDEKFGGAD